MHTEEPASADHVSLEESIYHDLGPHIDWLEHEPEKECLAGITKS